MLSALSHAWQSWKRAKTVGLLATVALAVGIGSTTAIYTVVNAVMLRPLPYPDGDRFVALYGAAPNNPAGRTALRFPQLIELERRTRSFDVFGWFTPTSFNLTSPGTPQHIAGTSVTPSLAHRIGVSPLLGDWFRDRSGAVLSHQLWRRLGTDRGIIGKPVVLNGRSYTVTGVMPPGFRLPVAGPGGDKAESDVWIQLDPLGRDQEPDLAINFCYARRKPGVSFAQAEAEVKSVAQAIARDMGLPPTYSVLVDDLRQDVISGIRPTLLLLFGAAGLLLLITCANVAGLMLARSVARARETAVKVALGAGQRSLAKQYFAEGLLVALAGAVIGAAASVLLVRVVVATAAEYIPLAEEISVDWRVLLFTLGTACLASALSGLAPLWQAIRTMPSDVLRDGVRVSASARSRRLSQSLVVAEIALAFMLLAVSTVLVVHLTRLTRIWPGFDPGQLLVFQLTAADSPASGAVASSSAKRSAYQQRLIDAIAAVPGVTNAAIVNQLPLDGCCVSTAIFPEGRTPSPELAQRVSLLSVTPDYLKTMRIPLRSGRFLEARDTNEDLLAVVINEAAARFYWPNGSPLGAFGRLGGTGGSRFQVIGVVGDTRNDRLGRPTIPEVYLLSTLLPPNPSWFLVRSPLPAATLVGAVRRTVQAIEPTQPIHGIVMMDEVAQRSVSLERVGSVMTTFFALAALLMATLGIYGIISYSVRQSTVDIGTRMALGALNRDVLLMFVGHGVKLAVLGVAIGAIAVVASTWFLVQRFGIEDFGWLPVVLSAAAVIGIATLASFFPAWRATLLSPMTAMRNAPGPT